MKPTTTTKLGLALAGVLALYVSSARADTFGSGGNQFTIDFVGIGNAGNTDDTGLNSTPHGGVGYVYAMGVTEVPQDWITKGGLTNVTAGPWTGNQPAANLTWYEAAAFVNYLNTSTGHQAAYQINAAVTGLTLWSSADAWQTGGENLYRHKDAFYFLPSTDEWYKAAYHRNDGVTGNYWDYATGSDTPPTAIVSGTGAGTAVKSGAGAVAPADVDNNGGLSAYGTRGQSGNVYEWMESGYIAPNDSTTEVREFRGGNWVSTDGFVRSSFRGNNPPSTSLVDVGFRVASVPEPSCAVLMLGTGLMFLLKRRRARSL